MFSATSSVIRSSLITRSLFIRSCATQQHQNVRLHDVDALASEYASGWAPPLGTLSDLPFTVYRTDSKLLPVYTRYKKHNTQFVTTLRKYRGDSSSILFQLRNLLGPDIKMKRYQGRIEIRGDHKEEIQTWLRRLGF